MKKWIKEVENPVLKPLNDWRDELYGYWMLVSDTDIVDGIRMARARYYGTDREKILDLWETPPADCDPSNVTFYNNKRSKNMGGAFLVKVDG